MQTQLAERKIVTEMPAVIVKTERDVRKQKLRMAAYIPSWRRSVALTTLVH